VWEWVQTRPESEFLGEFSGVHKKLS
jgi:hypothetical protein